MTRKIRRQERKLEETAKTPTFKPAVVLPQLVAEQLRRYKAESEALQARQHAYLMGVLQALGINGNVRLNVENGTYELADD